MPASDTQLQLLIDRATDDEAARSALLDHTCDRLLRLTRKMFHARPGLRRWEQTDDVFQTAIFKNRLLALGPSACSPSWDFSLSVAFFTEINRR